MVATAGITTAEETLGVETARSVSAAGRLRTRAAAVAAGRDASQNHGIYGGP